MLAVAGRLARAEYNNASECYLVIYWIESPIKP